MKIITQTTVYETTAKISGRALFFDNYLESENFTTNPTYDNGDWVEDGDLMLVDQIDFYGDNGEIESTGITFVKKIL